MTDISIKSNVEHVGILLGIDKAHMTTSIDTRIGREDNPIAIRIRLEWIVTQVIGNYNQDQSVRTHAVFSNMEEVFDALAKQMMRFCDSDDFRTEYKIDCFSESGRQVINILERETRRLTVCYEIPST